MSDTPQNSIAPVRVEFDTPEGECVDFRVKPMAISVTFDVLTSYTFDLTGRFYAAFAGGRNYRRGLDNRVLEKAREERDGHELGRRRMMGKGEARIFLEEMHGRMVRTGRALREGMCRIRMAEPSAEAAGGWFERIAAWDSEALERDGERFLEIYRPVSILPPDQYMALVVQVTEGCPWNRCTFCNFYRDRAFRIRSPEALRRHIGEVKAFLGAGIRLRRSIFLGDANALTAPWDRLKAAFGVVHEAFPAGGAGPPNGQIYAFTDAFGAGLRTAGEIEALAGMGLRRVYIGLETGHDPLLEVVQKQGRAGDVVEAARRMKAGGVQVGPIVMLGLGGERYAEAHVRDTVRTLNAMALDAGDIVYFSELVAPPELEYAHRAESLKIRPLTEEEMQAQMEAMRSGLRFSDAGRPKMSVYDIRRFIY